MDRLFDKTAKNPPKSIVDEITSLARAIYGSTYLDINFSDEPNGLFVGVKTTNSGGGELEMTKAMEKAGLQFRDVMDSYNEKTGKWGGNPWAVFKTKKGDWK